jgi:ribonuclease HIII
MYAVIILIPKVKDAKELKDHKPISLGNVIYKVVSKCSVNMLRPLLYRILSLQLKALLYVAA